MARRIATGIDIGTHQVKVVITEAVLNGGRVEPVILGTGTSETKGMRQGYVVHSADVVRSITAAVRAAEQEAQVKIKQAFLAIGGIGIEEHRTTGETITARADSEITELDIEKSIEAARSLAAPALVNRAELQTIPLEFRVDGEKVHTNRPQGMTGTKLETDVLFVTCLKQHLDDLISAVEEAGIEVLDEIASPLAESFVTLSREQKMLGCVLVNMGAETTSIVVYDHTIPVSVRVFDTGSADITADLALSLRIPPEDAEKLKLGRLADNSFPATKIKSAITARLKAIYTSIDKHLQDINKRMLPAGVILSGAGAHITDAKEIARDVLKLPSRKAYLSTSNQKISDPIWGVAYGLTIWGLSSEQEVTHAKRVRKARSSISSFIKQFLP